MYPLLLILACAAVTAQGVDPLPAFADDDGIEWRVPGTSRTILLGDLHADGDAYVAILAHLGLIDAGGHWQGGDARVVKAGDVINRGFGSRFIFDYDDALREEGARITNLLGNHEILRASGDGRWAYADELRVTAPLRFAEDTRFQFLDLLGDKAVSTVAEAVDFQKRLNKGQTDTRREPGPMIYLDRAEEYAHFHAFTSAASRYARGLATSNTFFQVDDTLIVHADLAEWLESDPRSTATLGNATVRKYIVDLFHYHLNPLRHPCPEVPEVAGGEGPLWGRSIGEGMFDPSLLKRILAGFGARRLAVGHTITPSRRIERHFDGAVYRIDTAVSSALSYKPGAPRGSLSALEIRPGKEPVAHDAIPRPVGMHPIRRRWEAEFQMQRRANPDAVELFEKIDEFLEAEQACPYLLLEQTAAPRQALY